MRPLSITLTPIYCRAYLPTLIPVEVDESKTKPWFRSLLSGIEFLHKRGVVHNDIKCVTTILILLRDARYIPSYTRVVRVVTIIALFILTKPTHRPANILLSEERVPVLVDFGFAEKYDLKSGKAFHSNLMYGTPEVSQKSYLCTSVLCSYRGADFACCPGCSTYPLNVLVASRTTRVNRTSGP